MRSFCEGCRVPRDCYIIPTSACLKAHFGIEVVASSKKLQLASPRWHAVHAVLMGLQCTRLFQKSTACGFGAALSASQCRVSNHVHVCPDAGRKTAHSDMHVQLPASGIRMVA